jgi:hypothetical protein
MDMEGTGAGGLSVGGAEGKTSVEDLAGVSVEAICGGAQESPSFWTISLAVSTTLSIVFGRIKRPCNGGQLK